MIKIFCDLCGKEITGDIHKVGLGIVDGTNIVPDDEHADIETDMDFCGSCIKLIADTIRARDIKPRVKVDSAKVWALKDAGWKTREIAHDFYCTEQEVLAILNKPRPAMERAYDKA